MTGFRRLLSMASRKPHLSPAEQKFWDDMMEAAVWPILQAHDGQKITPTGAAHLCAEFADKALAERRLRFS